LRTVPNRPRCCAGIRPLRAGRTRSSLASQALAEWCTAGRPVRLAILRAALRAVLGRGRSSGRYRTVGAPTASSWRDRPFVCGVHCRAEDAAGLAFMLLVALRAACRSGRRRLRSVHVKSDGGGVGPPVELVAELVGHP